MEQELNGWLNIDKPLGYSSAKTVAIIKKLLKAKKVGHGGTLDPLATGVLPICINKATKTVEKMMSFEKEYLFNITFTELRSTADEEGEIIERNTKIPTEDEIIEILPKFIGEIDQIPPIYSAIKINGKKGYELARNSNFPNIKIELSPRKVKVKDIKFLKFLTNKVAQFSIECGKGFYVRSFAVDLSRALNTVGYISYLRRTAVGIFNQNNILTIEEIQNLTDNGKIINKLINI